MSGTRPGTYIFGNFPFEFSEPSSPNQIIKSKYTFLCKNKKKHIPWYFPFVSFFLPKISFYARLIETLLSSVLHRVKKLQNCCGSTRRNLYRKKNAARKCRSEFVGKSGLIFYGNDNRGCKEKRKVITKEISFNKQWKTQVWNFSRVNLSLIETCSSFARNITSAPISIASTDVSRFHSQYTFFHDCTQFTHRSIGSIGTMLVYRNILSTKINYYSRWERHL